MVTLTQVKTKVNSVLQDIYPKILAKQEAYFAKHGRYCQLLITPEVVVIDGVDSTFKKRFATYEKNGVDFDFSYLSKIPFQIEIYQHQRNKEFGFTAIVTISVNGNSYRQAKGYNLGITQGWHLVEEPNSDSN